jgi:hypothetical protein
LSEARIDKVAANLRATLHSSQIRSLPNSANSDMMKVVNLVQSRLKHWTLMLRKQQRRTLSRIENHSTLLRSSVSVVCVLLYVL